MTVRAVAGVGRAVSQPAITLQAAAGLPVTAVLEALATSSDGLAAGEASARREAAVGTLTQGAVSLRAALDIRGKQSDEDAQIFFEQHDVGGVFGDVGGGIDGDADVGRVQRLGVVTPSPRNPTSQPVVRCRRMMRAFCSGVTRAKIVVPANILESCSSLRAAACGPVRTPETSRPSSRQTARAVRSLSPVTSLTVTPSCAKRGRRPAHLREYDQIRPHGDIVKLRQHVQRGRERRYSCRSPDGAVANLAQQRERNGDPER